MFSMLTKKDLQQIGELMDSNLEKFAIIINASFDDVYKRFDGIDKRLDNIESRMAEKIDITRLEGKLFGYSNRLEKVEDDIRMIKTKINI
jgi:tetrahydromethanopterin S-methyltransferase subunit G